MSELIDIPMSVLMKRALEASKKWTAEEQVDSLIQCGALEESEREEAVERVKRAMLREQRAKQKKKAARSRAKK